MSAPLFQHPVFWTFPEWLGHHPGLEREILAERIPCPSCAVVEQAQCLLYPIEPCGSCLDGILVNPLHAVIRERLWNLYHAEHQRDMQRWMAWYALLQQTSAAA